VPQLGGTAHDDIAINIEIGEIVQEVGGLVRVLLSRLLSQSQLDLSTLLLELLGGALDLGCLDHLGRGLRGLAPKGAALRCKLGGARWRAYGRRADAEIQPELLPPRLRLSILSLHLIG
jgi:hypothetical protein